MAGVIEQREILRWEDPPPSGRHPLHQDTEQDGRGAGRPPGSQWDAVAQELRARPGQYALIFKGSLGAANSLVTRINYSMSHCWRPFRSFEAVTRRRSSGCLVYVRYRGE